MRVSTDVGRLADNVASVSSDADLAPSRACVSASFTAANRSTIGISLVGTSSFANENALLPEDSVRVLMAIDVRNDSTGAPRSR